MPCCCFPFRTKKLSEDYGHIDDGHFRNNVLRDIDDTFPTKTYDNCNFADMAPIAPAFVSHKDNEIMVESPDLPLEKIPSNSTQSYKTVRSFDEETTMPIDYTNDSQDDTQEAGYSLDGLECSNFVLTDYSYAKFQDTILDSPLTYEDISGRSQSMRRYSSAVADRAAFIDQMDNINFDSEPLNLSSQYFENEHQRHSPSRMPINPFRRHRDDCPYMEELKETLPQARKRLRSIPDAVILNTVESSEVNNTTSISEDDTQPSCSFVAVGKKEFLDNDDVIPDRDGGSDGEVRMQKLTNTDDELADYNDGLLMTAMDSMAVSDFSRKSEKQNFL